MKRNDDLAILRRELARSMEEGRTYRKRDYFVFSSPLNVDGSFDTYTRRLTTKDLYAAARLIRKHKLNPETKSSRQLREFNEQATHDRAMYERQR